VWCDGVLIPVRYLLNGVTVTQETVEAVAYWHVELAKHAVLLAEGLPCESYLDTGNRSAFADCGASTMLHPDFARQVWDAEACAELVLEGPPVVAAKQALLARAARAGHVLTDDPGLRVLVDGQPVAVEVAGPNWHLRLQPGARRVRLVSATWIPAHARPQETDTRSLGVAIGRIWLDRREVGRDSAGLSAGWHDPEPGWRWTDGDAEMLLDGVQDLLFEVAVVGSYWKAAAPTQIRRAPAPPCPG
jgi:hypothetical protein